MKILFVCSGNVGRSQMAMEFYRQLCPPGDSADSAGVRVPQEGEVIGSIDKAQNIMAAMREVGIDMTANSRTTVTPAMLADCDLAIVMVEPERTPEWLLTSPKYRYWPIDNQKALPIEEVRPIRDAIRARVEALLDS